MQFLHAKMTLGGKLSLSYLAIITPVAVAGGYRSEVLLIACAWPMAAFVWVLGYVTDMKTFPPAVGITILGLAWIGNAYLYGHFAALLIWLWQRFTREDDDADGPDEPTA